MLVQALTVGPIVGYTTSNKVRLWGRGKFDPSQPVVGVAEMIIAGTTYRKQFPMKPYFDFTGIVEFEGLTAANKYSYKVGYVSVDSEDDSLDLASLDFSPITAATFQTPPESTYTDISFVFGSCRYVLSFLGNAILDNRGDKTFRAIQEQITVDNRRTDFILMVGDQIYSDPLNFLTPKIDRDALSDFHDRYRDAFSTPHLRKLMSQLPTYMILDDHEIRDNWSQDEVRNNHHLYNIAMSAYQSYQLIHGPAFQFAEEDRFASTPSKLYYSFSVGGSQFFVTDVRTERFKKVDPPQIISQAQMRALKDWLQQAPNTPKFIATPVPVFPNNRIGAEDKWAGFVQQRDELLDFIRSNQIKKVVFLSGDVHFSTWSTLTCPTDPTFKVHSVISSPFFWPRPFSFGSSDELVHEGTLTTINGHDYEVKNGSSLHSESNFTRLTVQQNRRLLVEIYDRKGGLLSNTSLSLE